MPCWIQPLADARRGAVRLRRERGWRDGALYRTGGHRDGRFRECCLRSKCECVWNQPRRLIDNTAVGSNANASGNGSFNTATGGFSNASGAKFCQFGLWLRSNASGANARNSAFGAGPNAPAATMLATRQWRRVNARAIPVSTPPMADCPMPAATAAPTLLAATAPMPDGNTSFNTATGPSANAAGDGSFNTRPAVGQCRR